MQIFGRSKCFDTKKAERYFKERKIKFQSVDLDRWGMSRKELECASLSAGTDALIDEKSALYEGFNFPYIIRSESDKRDILFENPKLIKSPIVRNGRSVTVGYCPQVWKDWE